MRDTTSEPSSAPPHRDTDAVARIAGRLAAIAVAAALLLWLPDLGIPGGTLVVVAVLACGYVRIIDGGLGPIGLPWPVRTRDVAIGVSAALVLYVASKLVIGPLTEWVSGAPRDLSRFDALRGNPGLALRQLATIWATAAFAEETLFRGFLWSQLRAGFGDRPAVQVLFVVLSSVLFGAVHLYQSIAGALQTGIVGALLAVLFLGTGRRLWANIVAHGVYDSISLLLIYTSTDRALERLLISSGGP